MSVTTSATQPLTQRQTIAAIRALGLTVSIRDREYRITFRSPVIAEYCAALLGRIPSHVEVSAKAEDIAYYTDDRQDALVTARFMAARLPLKVR